jgi:hypothetical protein
VDHEIRSKDGYCPPSTTEKDKKLRLTLVWQVQEGRAGTAHKPLDLGKGDLYRLGFES